MPQVVQALQQKYGKTPRSFDPAGAVAKGAALLAQRAAAEEAKGSSDGDAPIGRIGDVKVHNVSSRSYGVNAFDMKDDVEKLFIILPRNATLPAEGHNRFNPRNDNQRSCRFAVMESLSHQEIAPMSEGKELGEALLEPTVIYVKPVLRCMEAADVKGVSHITGGGFFENIPRCIPEGLGAKIDKAAVRTPAIFKMLQEQGNISEHDMFNTFNMGVGMTVVVPKEDADRAIAALDCGAYVVGEIVSGGEKVTLC